MLEVSRLFAGWCVRVVLRELGSRVFGCGVYDVGGG